MVPVQSCRRLSDRHVAPRLQVRAGVQGKIAAAMEQTEALEGQLESMAASHAKQLAALRDRCSSLEEHLAQEKKAADDLAAQCSAAELRADRSAPLHSSSAAADLGHKMHNAEKTSIIRVGQIFCSSQSKKQWKFQSDCGSGGAEGLLLNSRTLRPAPSRIARQ